MFASKYFLPTLQCFMVDAFAWSRLNRSRSNTLSKCSSSFGGEPATSDDVGNICFTINRLFIHGYRYPESDVNHCIILPHLHQSFHRHKHTLFS